MRINTRRTITGHNRSPLAVLPSQLTTNSNPVNNYRCYNFADDDTSVKYPIAIRITDKNSTQFNVIYLYNKFCFYYFHLKKIRFLLITHPDHRLTLLLD